MNIPLNRILGGPILLPLSRENFF